MANVLRLGEVAEYGKININFKQNIMRNENVNEPLNQQSCQNAVMPSTAIQYEFEKDIELRDYILEMASTGKAPKKWSQFVWKIEDLFKKSNESECKHEILDQHFSDVFGHYFTCKKCGKEINQQK